MQLYSGMMKQYALVILLLLLLNSLTACRPGHLGSTVIAFLRHGHLWTIDPNGANAFEVVAQDTPVVGYSWSPTHHLLAFRTLDADFAQTSLANHLMSQPMTGLIEDTPSVENTIGVDGGTSIPIAFSNPHISYSNALWNVNGTRLLYRQTMLGAQSNPLTAQWFLSQDDQPGSIAVKAFPASYAIPSFSYLSQSMHILGDNDHGIFTTTLAGTNQHSVIHHSPLPASLERILWRPAHQDRSFLYAIRILSSIAPNNILDRPTVQLILGTSNGQSITLATCNCAQFAWSPDGNTVLYCNGDTNYTILNLQHNTTWNFIAENGSVPYWSPDSQFLLLDGPHALQLLNVAQERQSTLLSDGQGMQGSGDRATQLTSVDAFLQPVPNSVWAADSRHFVFLTQGRLLWQGHKLQAGHGLYTVTINDDGIGQGSPTLVDGGDDTQAGWTYQDVNTSFLY